jgi:hypothetical protein
LSVSSPLLLTNLTNHPCSARQGAEVIWMTKTVRPLPGTAPTIPTHTSSAEVTKFHSRSCIRTQHNLKNSQQNLGKDTAQFWKNSAEFGQTHSRIWDKLNEASRQSQVVERLLCRKFCICHQFELETDTFSIIVMLLTECCCRRCLCVRGFRVRRRMWCWHEQNRPGHKRPFTLPPANLTEQEA